MLKKYALDTNVLNNINLIMILREKVNKNEIKIYLSPIVILEYGFIQYVRGKLEKFLTLLKELKVQVFQITQKDSLLAIKHAYHYKNDTKGPMYYFRDALIAASSEIHMIPLLTNNIKDFIALPDDLKIKPEEFIN